MTKIKKTISKPFKWFLRKSKKKKIIIAIIILVAFFIISGQISNATKPPGYTTQKVTKADIIEQVTESGNISGGGKIPVFSPTNGIVTEMYVRNGEYVEKGTKLFKVESSATQQESEQARANYLAAVSALNTAQSNANLLRAEMYGQWKTFTDLASNSTYEKGDDTPNEDNRKAAEFQISQDRWLSSEKKFKDQQTAIAQAQAQVSSTNLLYQATVDSVVIAQRDGVVTNLSTTTGGTVNISSPTLPAKPVLILTRDSSPEVTIQLSESDVSKVVAGQKAKITVNALGDKSFDALVDRVDSIGTDTQGVITYNAYLSILNDDPQLRAGMGVDAKIVTEELKDILSVPNSAVKPYQGGRAVRVPDNESSTKFKYVPVIIGIRGENRTQIIKGLSEGQEIIIALQNEALKRPGVFGN